MSGRTFTAAIGTLFERLDLGAPKYDASDIVRLVIDRTTVEFWDGGLSQLLIGGTVGRLPEEPAGRVAATREILRVSAGMLLDNSAGFHLRRDAGGSEVLAVRGAFLYRDPDTERLISTLEDVVHLLEVGRAVLGSVVPGHKPHVRITNSDADEAVIFRP